MDIEEVFLVYYIWIIGKCKDLVYWFYKKDVIFFEQLPYIIDNQMKAYIKYYRRMTTFLAMVPSLPVATKR